MKQITKTCTVCGKEYQGDPRTRYCAECRKKISTARKNKATHEKYWRRKANHQCVYCGDTLLGDYTNAMCEWCRKHVGANMKSNYQQKKAEHKCVLCGKELPEGYTQIRCEECRAKQSEWHKLSKINRKIAKKSQKETKK